jgi:hypothetical protein
VAAPGRSATVETSAAPRRRALVVWYSQTGQLKRCADALVRPLADAGFDVVAEQLRPVRDYPFPWSLRAFLDVFADTVTGVTPALERPSVDGGERFDLVVVAYQVWYLAPSLPVQAFFASPHSSLLAGTPVVTLVACRNMWYSAALAVRRMVERAGGVHVGHVAAVDSGPAWATFVTTPRWLLTGRRGRFLKVFPPAGIGDDAVARLAELGARLAARPGAPVFDGLDPFRVDTRMALPDLLGRIAFEPWARLIARTRRPAARRALQLAFAAWMTATVPVAVPALALTRPLLGGLVTRRLRVLDGPGRVVELVHA